MARVTNVQGAEQTLSIKLPMGKETKKRTDGVSSNQYHNCSSDLQIQLSDPEDSPSVL
jgi:hypothetical protein